MIDGKLVADSIISLSAFVGLVMFISVLRTRDRDDPLYPRFRFGLSVLAIVMLSRVMNWVFPSSLASFVTLAAAGTIPLAALLITEGLMRRHAPPGLKLFAAAGMLLFLVLAVLPIPDDADWLDLLLFGFQLTIFIAIGVMVVTRDRSQLSASENKTIERLGLSLLIIVPTTVTDYRFEGFDLPVRLAGIAILCLCWFGIGIGRPETRHRDTVTSFAVLAAAAGVAGASLALIAGLDFAGLIQAIAITLSVLLVAVICNDSLSLRAEDRRSSLLKYLAQGDISDGGRFLTGLRDYLKVDGALIVEGSDLDDFDQDGLREALLRYPVLSAGDLRGIAVAADAREQLQSLLDRYEATFLMLTREAPLQIVVLNMPSLTVSAATRIELQAVQRMAVLISR
ncbi:hypothetical protein [Rhizobium sp. RU36D]|uniref:hypothetical protein n=1 Tax=Rhizobium sp. RU36D TaxID=1907415 RepID=UPI0009D7FBB2|nr:hypothetical protein [Rhizobium sp. RU36D]SMD15748.1 hypothetical protein SAMN05880593_12826 [Rhizobium sp. RU36D]